MNIISGNFAQRSREMMNQLVLSRTKKDYMWTLATTGFVFLSGIAVYYLASKYLGPDGFSEFTLSRRTVAFIVPLLMVGLGVGMPREVAYRSNVSPTRTGEVFYSSLILTTVTSVVALAGINLFPGFVAKLCYGDASYRRLLPSLSLYVVGTILSGQSYAYFRGLVRMRRANVFLAANFGIVPLLAFSSGPDSAAEILWWIGAGTTLVSFISLVLPGGPRVCIPINLLSTGHKLFSYSVRRLPGDIALQGLLTLPAIVTAHSMGVREGGLVAFSVSVLGLAMMPFTPISVLMLPHSVTLFQRREANVLRTYIKKVLLFGIIITGVAVIALAFGARLFIRLYLGSDYANAAPMLQIISFAMFPYCVYICLRSVIDAATQKAINSRNCIISLVFFLIPVYLALKFQFGAAFLLGFFVASMTLLGALSFKSCRKYLREDQFHWSDSS